jgi:hypothetical protein
MANIKRAIAFCSVVFIVMDFPLVKFLLCIYSKSNKEFYHVIFDRTVSWAENMSVVAWVALISHNKGLTRYLIMQCIKKCSTVRVSSKNEKASPRIVYGYGKQNESIRGFFETREIIKKISQKLQKNCDF